MGSSGTDGDGHDPDPIKPYERRALNFLVNEYLLLNDYKVSSVTLAEENEDQVRYGEGEGRGGRRVGWGEGCIDELKRERIERVGLLILV